MNVNEFVTIYSGGNYAAPIWDTYASYVLELITNGDFATDTDWTKGTGWTIGSGVASCNGATNGDYLSQTSNNALVLGKTYKVTFDVTRTSGTLLLMLASSNPSVNTSGNIITGGSKEFYITISTLTDQNIYFRSNSFNGTIDNVSVKEVGESVEGRDCTINNLARLIS